ncbi:2-hydroxyacid dehydrogenase [Haliangium sp.]
MRGTVVSSAALPFDIAPILGAVEYRAPATGSFDRAALLAALGDADALICLLTVAVDEALLEAAPGLRVVANFAVGYDNVDVAAATRRGVAVANTPGALTEATADFTFALLLGAARRLAEGDRLVRSGAWTGWAPGQHLGADVFGAELGLIGFGRIGQAVARRARGFSMTVRYTNGSGAVAPADQAHGAVRVELDELLARSDVVSLHCPLTPATRHIIDAAALAAMKPGAVLVNTARGACVDEAALVAALDRGHLGAAGLDVFEHEPAVPAPLRACARVLLAPHAGSATTTARRRMAETCARAVRAALDGRAPETVVNPEIYQT